jgi:hypothetical protein
MNFALFIPINFGKMIKKEITFLIKPREYKYCERRKFFKIIEV